MMPFFSARSVARSHIGSVRTVNEDRVFNAADHGLWAIADGMGGHARGDVAAEIVIGSLIRLIGRDADITLESIGASLDEANRCVLDLSGRAEQQSGSTVAGLFLDGDDAVIFWAGDSRVYRVRDGRFELMTHDHRVVQDMIDAGALTEAQARRHPRATVITRAVGASATLELASRVERARAGDVYLLCSDGLTDMVAPDMLARAVDRDAAEAADECIRLALATGGTDNISLVIVSLDPAGIPSAAPASAGHCATRF